jgi:hypothetical protein
VGYDKEFSMGYHIDQCATEFFLPCSQKRDAFRAFVLYAGEGNPNDVSGDFLWCDPDAIEQATNLEGLLTALRWRPTCDKEGNIINVEYEGGKLGEDEEIWGVFAPFIRSGSFIEMEGEDGECWRWVFDGKECHHVPASGDG